MRPRGSSSVIASAPMGRKVDVEDLVSVSEIAELLGLKNAGLVNTWRRHYADFAAERAGPRALIEPMSHERGLAGQRLPGTP